MAETVIVRSPVHLETKITAILDEHSSQDAAFLDRHMRRVVSVLRWWLIGATALNLAAFSALAYVIGHMH
jgi:hypothetical protein